MITPSLHHAELDGKGIAFSSMTTWFVQLGKGRGSYRTQWRFVGPDGLRQAVSYYRALNVGNGYKKRLFSPDLNKPTLARCFS